MKTPRFFLRGLLGAILAVQLVPLVSFASDAD